MALSDLTYKFSDAHARRRRAREQKKLLSSAKRSRRRKVVLKTLACLLIVGMFAVFALFVGNADYEATMVGWVPCIMAVCCIALAGLYTLIMKNRISFEETSNVTDCRRDSDVTFTVTLRNRSFLYAFRMTAFFYIADMYGEVASEASTTLSLGPFEEYEMPFSTRFEHIGTYAAGLERIEVSDFLGLFSFTLENPTRRVVHVMPKIMELDQIEFSNDALEETTKAAKSVLADSMDYAYVREYVPGDPLKTIHWKLSARAGGYMTRLYEVYTNPGVDIVMDFYGPSDNVQDMAGMYDAVVESAFSLSRYARKRGFDAEIHYCNKYGEHRRILTWDEQDLVDVIAELPPMSNDPLFARHALDIIAEQTTVARGQNNIFCCSANVDADMVSAIVEAKARRRSPYMVAVVPGSLLGREREDHCASLHRLDSAEILYSIIARSDELEGAVVVDE